MQGGAYYQSLVSPPESMPSSPTKMIFNFFVSSFLPILENRLSVSWKRSLRRILTGYLGREREERVRAGAILGDGPELHAHDRLGFVRGPVLLLEVLEELEALEPERDGGVHVRVVALAPLQLVVPHPLGLHLRLVLQPLLRRRQPAVARDGVEPGVGGGWVGGGEVGEGGGVRGEAKNSSSSVPASAAGFCAFLGERA